MTISPIAALPGLVVPNYLSYSLTVNRSDKTLLSIANRRIRVTSLDFTLEILVYYFLTPMTDIRSLVLTISL